MIGVSLFSVAFWGLKLGTDFSGGSSLTVEYKEGSSIKVGDVKLLLDEIGFSDASLRYSGDNAINIKTREISQIEKSLILEKLTFGNTIAPVEKNFSNVGPVLGKEAIQKSLISISLVLVAIILFVAFAFRKVSKPISSWVYGSVAILALLHDVIVPTGVFAILGYFFGFEVDTLFVTALLVILGFSVHDTIVVFDRVRENLNNVGDSKNIDFESIVGKSISETVWRSINTSLTTLLSIVALYVWGPESVHHFSLALLIGIAVGTYSSIFIGSPLLVTINNWKNKK